MGLIRAQSGAADSRQSTEGTTPTGVDDGEFSDDDVSVDEIVMPDLPEWDMQGQSARFGDGQPPSLQQALTPAAAQAISTLSPAQTWAVATRLLPEHLQIPDHASLGKRVEAAAYDAGIALALGLVASSAVDLAAHMVNPAWEPVGPSAIAYLQAFDPTNWFSPELLQKVPFLQNIASYGGLTAVQCAGNALGFALGLTWFALRDGLTSESTRSLGKRLAGLEVTKWDGEIVGRRQALWRNGYMLTALLAPTDTLFLCLTISWVCVDTVLMTINTRDLRRVGDWTLGTRVVDERPDRAERVQYALDKLEIAELDYIVRRDLGAEVADKTRPGASVDVAAPEDEVKRRFVVNTEGSHARAAAAQRNRAV